MSKPKTNFVIEEDKTSAIRLTVWTVSSPISTKKLIEVIDGIATIYHDTTLACLSIYLNPCYDKKEVIAEIKESIDAATD